MALTEEQKAVARKVAMGMDDEVGLSQRTTGWWPVRFAERFIAALPKPEPVGEVRVIAVERDYYRQIETFAEFAAGIELEDGQKIYTEAPIAPPASEPDDTCYDDIKLAEMILSDCGCSTINNRSLVERVADRIARHKAPPASEQKPVVHLFEIYEQMETPFNKLLSAQQRHFLFENEYELKYLPIYADQPDPTYIVKWAWEVRDKHGASVAEAHEWMYQAINNAQVAAIASVKGGE